MLDITTHGTPAQNQDRSDRHFDEVLYCFLILFCYIDIDIIFIYMFFLRASEDLQIELYD